MDQLETKMVDAKREMAIADALDEIRTRNARNERVIKEGGGDVEAVVHREKSEAELERERIEREDEEAVRRAFGRVKGVVAEEPGMGGNDERLKAAGGDTSGGAEVLETALDGAIGVVTETEGPALGNMASGGLSRAETDAAEMPPPPPTTTFKRGTKRKKDFGAALGIKKKAALV